MFVNPTLEDVLLLIIDGGMQVQIEESWKKLLVEEFQRPYFAQIKKFLLQERQQEKKIYPLGSNIFSAFDICPVDNVKVVILGQDPYH